jgi:hypothetical protein
VTEYTSNVKPAVGFTLPSAGVTPAPTEKRRCGTWSLVELFLSHPESCCVIPSEAEGPRIFLNASRRTPITDQTQRMTLELHPGVCVIQSEAKNPDSFSP